jgi:hypothetical protein
MVRDKVLDKVKFSAFRNSLLLFPSQHVFDVLQYHRWVIWACQWGEELLRNVSDRVAGHPSSWRHSRSPGVGVSPPATKRRIGSQPSHGMTAHYPNRYRYRDRDRFTLQFDIDTDFDFDFDEALANTNKSNMINGGRRDWRLPSTKKSKNVHFFELWDHCKIWS